MVRKKHVAPDPAGRILLAYNEEGDVFTEEMAWLGTLIFGSPGSGKSSFSGYYTLGSFLRAGMGGLLTTTKTTDLDDYRKCAEAAGRADDLIVFSPESGQAFDPIFFEFARPGRGAGNIENLVQLFTALMAVGKKETGASKDPFWERASEQLMRHGFVLLSLSDTPVSLAALTDLVQSLPEYPEQIAEAAWQEQYCGRLLTSIDSRKQGFTRDQWSDLEQASRYVSYEWPLLDPRTRASIKITFSGMADRFLISPFHRMFCSGRCTVFPEDCYTRGSIIVLDLPFKLFGESGRFAQILFKLSWMRAIERRNCEQFPASVFLFQDEFQNFITKMDNQFQQTARQSRVCTVCLTQSISNLSEQLGEHMPGSLTRAYVGNLRQMLFHQQNESATLNFAAEQFGREYVTVVEAGSEGRAHCREDYRWVLEPSAFTRLHIPTRDAPYSQAFLYQGGEIFRATQTNHLLTVFAR